MAALPSTARTEHGRSTKVRSGYQRRDRSAREGWTQRWPFFCARWRQLPPNELSLSCDLSRRGLANRFAKPARRLDRTELASWDRPIPSPTGTRVPVAADFAWIGCETLWVPCRRQTSRATHSCRHRDGCRAASSPASGRLHAYAPSGVLDQLSCCPHGARACHRGRRSRCPLRGPQEA